MSQDLNLQPLLDTRARMEQLLQEKLDGVAVLRKKIEALSMAIDILRNNDEEVRNTILPNNTSRTIRMDAEIAEVTICEFLQQRDKAKVREITAHLNHQGIPASEYGVKKILANSQRFQRFGEREQTSYALREAV